MSKHTHTETHTHTSISTMGTEALILLTVLAPVPKTEPGTR